MSDKLATIEVLLEKCLIAVSANGFIRETVASTEAVTTVQVTKLPS
jgi:hypothetical protein